MSSGKTEVCEEVLERVIYDNNLKTQLKQTEQMSVLIYLYLSSVNYILFILLFQTATLWNHRDWLWLFGCCSEVQPHPLEGTGSELQSSRATGDGAAVICTEGH